MKRSWNRFKREFEEDPVKVIAVCAAATTAMAMFLNAYANARRSSVWKKEVNRRDRMTG